jgi:homopolymeric O-antigen transport system permease protein
MTRVVYTSELQEPLRQLLSPSRVVGDLLRHREVIRAFVKRDFHATYRGTYLGPVWSVLSPLIMLALFTFVFGGIFHGRFTHNASETPAQFALAMFIGLSLFNCFSQSVNSGPGLVLANTPYVKTLNFPLQVLSVAAVLQMVINMAIALALCLAIFYWMNGFLYWSAVGLIPFCLCVALFSVGCSWLLAALGVFIRDLPSIVGPITTVLMFLSSVFFSIESVPPRVRWFVELNPLALIIDQSRGCVMYGKWPDFRVLAVIFALSLLIAMLGYAAFMRMKPAFSDVV